MWHLPTFQCGESLHMQRPHRPYVEVIPSARCATSKRCHIYTRHLVHCKWAYTSQKCQTLSYQSQGLELWCVQSDAVCSSFSYLAPRLPVQHNESRSWSCSHTLFTVRWSRTSRLRDSFTSQGHKNCWTLVALKLITVPLYLPPQR